jgi:hypothetical protein
LDYGPLRESRPVAQIADEHGGGIRARMAVDGAESHLTEHDRSAYRPADYSRTISCLVVDFNGSNWNRVVMRHQ